MYCKDCKFWITRRDYLGRSYTVCDAVDLIDKFEDIEDDEFAIYADALDAVDLDVDLKTGAMFGCVKFKQAVVGKNNV